MCIRRWMVKKNVACIHNWILLSLEEEGTPVTWYTMGEAWGHYAKWNKPVTKMIIPLLYTPTYVYCIIPLMKRSESVSDLVVSNSLWPHGLWPTRLLCPWDSPGKNTGVCSHSLLQGIFLTQGSNSGLLHCRQILYCLSHQGNPIPLICGT